MLTESCVSTRRSLQRLLPHRSLRLALGALLLAMLQGCGTLYVAQAARGQWSVMRQRQPIERLIADDRTPESLRARLTEVSAARDFASRELHLPDNGSYRTYADLQRPYVVWNVVATPEFSIQPRKSCFPIVGCVAYRGYFNEQSARRYAERLRRRGYDVVVGGVPAYSTLGRFADPVLNTMLGYGDTELAAIIFHELAHQVVYVAGDTEFNEAFAVTVERAGLERWLKHRGRESQLESFKARRARQVEYIALFTRTRAKLAALYASKLPEDEMRARKKEIFAALEHQMRELEKAHGVPSPYGAWLKEGLNNAHLASVATYFNCVPGFERLLASVDGDLQAFYSAVRELAGKPRAERHKAVCTAPVSESQPVVPGEETK